MIVLFILRSASVQDLLQRALQFIEANSFFLRERWNYLARGDGINNRADEKCLKVCNVGTEAL